MLSGFRGQTSTMRSLSCQVVADECGGPLGGLARTSHHLRGEARDTPAMTSLRLLTVLTVKFKYASLVEWERRAARAWY